MPDNGEALSILYFIITSNVSISPLNTLLFARSTLPAFRVIYEFIHFRHICCFDRHRLTADSAQPSDQSNGEMLKRLLPEASICWNSFSSASRRIDGGRIECSAYRFVNDGLIIDKAVTFDGEWEREVFAVELCQIGASQPHPPSTSLRLDQEYDP